MPQTMQKQEQAAGSSKNRKEKEKDNVSSREMGQEDVQRLPSGPCRVPLLGWGLAIILAHLGAGGKRNSPIPQMISISRLSD